MGFFSSFKSQLGRDTGRLLSNKIFGKKHAIRHQSVGDENATKSNRKINDEYSHDSLREIDTKLILELQNKIEEIEEDKELESRLINETANIISCEIPREQNDLVNALNELSLIIISNPWGSAEEKNKKSNAYADVALKKYELCLHDLKYSFPQESKIEYFELQLVKFKKMSFHKKYLGIILAIFALIIIIIFCIIMDRLEKLGHI